VFEEVVVDKVQYESGGRAAKPVDKAKLLSLKGGHGPQLAGIREYDAYKSLLVGHGNGKLEYSWFHLQRLGISFYCCLFYPKIELLKKSNVNLQILYRISTSIKT